MDDETPLQLIKKRRLRAKSDVTLSCIIHCCSIKATSKVTPLTDTSFKKIKETCHLRACTGSNQCNYDIIAKNMPEKFLQHIHGYHRVCYQKFTNISGILKREASSSSEYQKYPPKRRRPSTDVLFPKDECLFCQKLRKKRKGKEEPLTKCQTVAASDLIKETALAKHDFVVQAKVNDTDLVAREAYYHRSCYRDFIKDHERNTVQARGDEEAKKVHDAHAAAFQFLSEHIQRSIIDESNVERLGMLREKYLRFLQEHYPDQYNPDYKTGKLKDKIKRTFGNKITFWQPNYRSDLVYSTYIDGGQAVETAFQAAASQSRRSEEAAMHLRRSIFDAHREARDMPWPPPPGNALKDWEFPPEQLSNFISVLLVGKKMDKLSNDQSRRIMSICQDILYAVTNGRWLQSKHILLAMSLCHLTGRADIIRLINRFGHCISYSKLLEILTAIHMVTTDHSSHIPPGIHTEGNQVVHFCWDNFDLNEETPSGAGTTHSTHGIIIQEADPTLSQVAPIFPSVEKTKKRSLAPETTVMEPCFVKRVEPNIPKPPANVEPLNESSSENDILWVLARHLNQGEQIVPGWGGWISLTGDRGEERQTTIEYMPPVNAQITDNATVKHIIQTSQEMTAAIGQSYTIITFDLAAAKKAYEMTWSNPERYDNVIICLGAFHTACTYIGALGKYMKGSGIEDVMVESSVCASGSIEKVLSGKHYNRARYVLRTTVEALERLLLMSFQDEEDERLGEEEIKLMSNVAHNPSSEALEAVKKIPEWKRWMEKYEQYKTKMRKGEKGKTAQFWVCFMDKVWLLMQFLKATKTNDLTLHIQCLQQMCSLFFSQNKQNYARYTSVYVNNLLALPQTHPGAFELFEKGGMSVNRSEVPNSRNAVDITIEQTYNRHASGHGPGIIGFSRNVAAYHRWSSTRHARAEYLQATLNSAGLETDEVSSHKDVNPSEIAKGEHIVKKMVNAFQNFMNPFSVPDDSKLYCISSGRPVSTEVEADLLQVDEHGTKAYKSFIRERLVEKSVSINAPIKRQKLKTFISAAQKTSVTSSMKKTKEIVAERNVFGQLILLAMKNEICMEKVMTFPFGPIPWSLATADGAPIKTDKSKLLHNLEKGHSLTESPESPVHVIDGNAVIQALTQVPETFGQLAQRIFHQLPKASRVDFVTDTYKENSIKNVERERRGTSQQLLVQGPLTKVPRDFKQFLANSSNKTQLLNLILQEWQTNKYAEKLKGREVTFVCGEICWRLTSEDGYKTDVQEVPNLQSTQEEADTRIILHCLDIAAQFPDSGGIVVRSPDTDVFLLLMRNAHSIPVPLVMDTGVGNKRRMININAAVKSVGEDICSVLLPFHAFTGCDTTSAFGRKGKIGPLRLLQKNPKHIKTFAALGTSPYPSAELCKELEAFACMMYGARSGVRDINRLRYTMFITRYTPKNQLLSSDTGIDTSLIPPCRSSLKMHILRANYQTMIWNQANVQYPELPQPYEGQGWEMKGQTLCYKWVDGDILPKELVDLTMEQDAEDIENEHFSIQDVIDDTDEEEEEEDVDEDN